MMMIKRMRIMIYKDNDENDNDDYDNENDYNLNGDIIYGKVKRYLR